MKAWHMFLGALCVTGFLGPAAAAERDVRHTFPVQPGCTLRVDTYRGTIDVTESDDGAVHVLIHMEVGGETEADAQRALAGLQLDVKAQENCVAIVARNPRETKTRWVWREDEQIGLFYRIAVPRHCNVEVKNINGDLTVDRLQGRMIARVESGNVFFRGVEGRVDASVSEGDIVISRCSGAVVARVGKGSIRTGTIGGCADLRNASGSVEVMAARAAVQAHATAGDVSVGFAGGIPSDSRLTTSGGNVFVRVDPTAQCRVEASSAWGRVHCDVPLAIESGGKGQRKLRGRFNQGGPLLALKASGGNVRIEAGETPFE